MDSVRRIAYACLWGVALILTLAAVVALAGGTP